MTFEEHAEKVLEEIWERGRITVPKDYKPFSSLLPEDTVIHVGEWTWAEFVEKLTALEFWLVAESEKYKENVRRLREEYTNSKQQSGEDQRPPEPILEV